MPLYVAILRHLDMGYRNIVNVIDITATGTISTTGAISSNSPPTNTLTTSGVALNIKSNLVRFRGLGNTIYINAYLGGVLLYSDMYIDTYLKIKNGLSLGSLSATDTWDEKMGVSGATGNISTNGSITAAGSIIG